MKRASLTPQQANAVDLIGAAGDEGFSRFGGERGGKRVVSRTVIANLYAMGIIREIVGPYHLTDLGMRLFAEK